MKAFYPRMRMISTLIVLILVYCICINKVKSQTWVPLQLTASPYSSALRQHSNLGVFSFRNYNEVSNPDALFHLKSGTSIYPLLFLEKDDYGTIKFLYQNGTGTNFGIYQSSSVTTYNYLESPLGLKGYLFMDGTDPKITVVGDPRQLKIMFTGNGMGDPQYPLVLDPDKVTVQDLLETNAFKLNDYAGLGKVLLSDAEGNGIWTDPANINDHKWIINDDDDLYAHPLREHVGIGFTSSSDKIYQRLHIVDGNILISRLDAGAPHSLNGSILFGDDQINDGCPCGKWGIEYYTYNGVNGLNFWTPYCHPDEGASPLTRDDADNFILFLKDDKTVGIGTSETNGYKLAVKGKVVCEELKVKLFDYWPDDVLQNDYKLLPLKDLEQYIKLYRHLPDIPTEKEIREQGANIGEMNAALLKKVEELTRYLIDQQNRIEAQQKQIDELKQKIDRP